ncbi:hypothetical protein ACOMHN_024380 [Nucella lapillus]
MNDSNDSDIINCIGRNKSSLTTFFADQLGRAGGDYHTTYFPQPTWLSTRNYFCMAEVQLRVTASGMEAVTRSWTSAMQYSLKCLWKDTTPAAWHIQVPGQKRVVRKETGVTVDSTKATRVERPNSLEIF